MPYVWLIAVEVSHILSTKHKIAENGNHTSYILIKGQAKTFSWRSRSVDAVRSTTDFNKM